MTREELINKIEDFKSMQNDIVILSQQLQMAKQHYNQEVKKFFGFCDGEPINVVQLFENILKAIS